MTNNTTIFMKEQEMYFVGIAHFSHIFFYQL